MSQALTTACARLFTPITREMRNLSRQLQPTPARARPPSIIKLLMQVGEHAHNVLLQDCVHGCGAWCASKARLQAAITFGRPCSAYTSTTGMLPYAYRQKTRESYDLASAQHGHQYARFLAMFACAKQNVATCM
eukprot:3096336-Pleurochrysis_carterae.AAC.1